MLRYEFPISVVNMKSIQEMLVFLTLLEPLNIDPDRISFIQKIIIIGNILFYSRIISKNYEA